MSTTGDERRRSRRIEREGNERKIEVKKEGEAEEVRGKENRGKES